MVESSQLLQEGRWMRECHELAGTEGMLTLLFQTIHHIPCFSDRCNLNLQHWVMHSWTFSWVLWEKSLHGQLLMRALEFPLRLIQNHQGDRSYNDERLGTWERDGQFNQLCQPHSCGSSFKFMFSFGFPITSSPIHKMVFIFVEWLTQTFSWIPVAVFRCVKKISECKGWRWFIPTPKGCTVPEENGSKILRQCSRSGNIFIGRKCFGLWGSPEDS